MLKEYIKKIPFLGSLAVKIHKKFTRTSDFTTSSKYWRDRYHKGGNSGAGSYNELAEYKGDFINFFVAKHPINTVIEFGCGDGNQLGYFQFPSYIGYDISNVAISHCQNLFIADTSKRFETLNHYKNETADLVLSLDVIYHLIEDDVYSEYMNRLFSASNKYIIVYSSNEDNHENNGIGPHVKHRNFTNWVTSNAPDFKLLEHIPNKYSFNGDFTRSSYADFYIFEKQ